MFKNKTLPRKKFIFLFIEPDRQNHRLLESAINEFEPHMNPLPTNVLIEIHTSNCKFENMISNNGIEEYVINAPFDDRISQRFCSWILSGSPVIPRICLP